ncbi:MAG: glycerol-3-phosphate acyltransferase [Erysipelotrichales bacterium]|nr:glycerol-3-phosphate acyltransferase [Erysipelotrichales bacterium]
MEYIIWVIIGYFSGSILFGYLVPKMLVGIDVRKVSDDGNPGAFNAIQHAGKAIGYLVVLLDVLKGAIPIYLASKVLDTNNLLFALVIVAPVIGHGFSCFSKFKGGKCLATACGIMVGLLPRLIPILTVCLVYIILSKLIVVTPHFCRIIITFSCAIVTAFVFERTLSIKLGIALVSSVVIKKHVRKMDDLKLRVTYPYLK